MEVIVIRVTSILPIGKLRSIFLYTSKSGTEASHTHDHLINMTKGIKMMVDEANITKNGAENKLVD